MVPTAPEELQKLLVGRKVGDKIDLPRGQFEVSAIYQIIDTTGAATTPTMETQPESTEEVEVPAESSEEDAEKALNEYMEGASEAQAS
jgi:hypothetical protein